MATLLHLTEQSRVDEAWEAYASLARKIAEDASLLSDRSFNQDLARKHERWRRLFLIQERG